MAAILTHSSTLAQAGLVSHTPAEQSLALAQQSAATEAMPVLLAQASPAPNVSAGVGAGATSPTSAAPNQQKGIVIEGKDAKLPIAASEISSVEVLDTDLLIRTAKGDLFVLPDGALKALSQPNAQIQTQSGDISLAELYRRVGQFKAIESSNYSLGIEATTVKPVQPDPISGNSLQIGAEKKNEAEQTEQLAQTIAELRQSLQTAQLAADTAKVKLEGLGPGIVAPTPEVIISPPGPTPNPKVVPNDNTSKEQLKAIDDTTGVAKILHSASAKLTNVEVSRTPGSSEVPFNTILPTQTTPSSPLAVNAANGATEISAQWGNKDTTVQADLVLSKLTGTLRAVLTLVDPSTKLPAGLLIDNKSLASGEVTLTADADGLVRVPLTWEVAEDGSVVNKQLFQVKVQYFTDAGLVKQSTFTFSYDDVKKVTDIAEFDKNGFQVIKLSAFGLSYDVTGNDAANDLINAGNGDDIVRGLGGSDTISGGRGNDVIYGGAGADTLSGDTGNDQLYGGSGDDRLDGGAGDDTLAGQEGADVMVGGTGTDTVSYSTSQSGVSVYLEAGRQALNSGGDAQGDTLASLENIVGSSFDDILTGDEGVNNLQGGSGSDTLEGRGGADVLDGGTDTAPGTSNTASYSLSDTAVRASLAFATTNLGDALGDTYINIQNLSGSRFGDILEGDGKNNILSGADGADTIKGGAGRDQLFGDGGDDVLIGGSQADTLNGGAGLDTASYEESVVSVTASLSGPNTADDDANGDTYTSIENLRGSNYNDKLTGDDKANLLEGLSGDDVLEGGAGADKLSGGSGMDTASYAGSSKGVSASLKDPNTNTEDAAGDRYDSIENLEGTDFADFLTGDSQTNRLYGGKGDDNIVGGSGGDFYFGGDGSDTADYTQSSLGVVAYLDAQEQSLNAGGASGDSYNSIENLTGSGLGDTLVGDSGKNVLKGGEGNDLLDGGRGTPKDPLEGDILDGGAGTDTADYSKAEDAVSLNLGTGGTSGDATGDTYTSIEVIKGSRFSDSIEGNTLGNSLYGGTGDDTLAGGGGEDFLYGGDGDDTLKNIGAGRHVYYGGDPSGDSGTDTVSYDGFGSAVTANLATNTANSTGAGGIEEYYGIENLVGGNANDKLTGNDGNNRLEGAGGDDIINGGGGNDILLGGIGNDTLIGGAGADVLNGQDGTDTVSYQTSSVGLKIDLQNASIGAGSGTGEAFGDTFTSIEIVRGSYHADTFLASTDSTLFQGGDEEVRDSSGNLIERIIKLDTVSFESSVLGVNVDLSRDVAGSSGATGGFAQGDTFTDIDNVMGSKVAANTLAGNSLANELTGGDVNDILDGAEGNDTLLGGAGDDVLTGGEGTDVLDGGTNSAAGGDTASYAYKTTSGVTITVNGANSENDTLLNIENLLGTGLNDTLTGDASGNVLDGAAGNDTLSGLAGNDTLLGGAGNDILIGGAGRDVLNGGPAAGSDTASYANALSAVTVSLSNTSLNTGDAEGDTFIQIDNLTGSNFNDTFEGNSFGNRFDGGTGTDTVTYANSLDRVIIDDAGGGEGDASGDTFVNIEKIIATSGDDIFRLSTTTTIFLDGGSGVNTLEFSNATAGVTANLSDTTKYANIQNMTGGIGNDSLTGDLNSNVLNGGLGNDVLEGGAGADTLNGGSETNGSNTASYANASIGVIASLATPAINTGDAAGDIYINIQNLLGGAGNDTLTGDANNNILTGAGGNNILNGGDGNDTFVGGAGTDTFNGGVGIDTVTYSSAVAVDLAAAGRSTAHALGDVFGADVEAFIGSGSNDTFYGRTQVETIDSAGGNDTVFGSLGADTLSGGAGNDTIDYSLTNTAVNVNLSDTAAESGGDAEGDVLTNFEILVGSGGNDVLTASNAGMTIRGGLGNDTITGGTSADTLFSGSGSDTVIGGAGDDRLDFVVGNTDANMSGDSANGGDGADVIAVSYAKWLAGNTGFTADGGAGSADALELQMSSDGLLNLSSLTASQFNNLEILDLSKDAIKTTLSLSSAGIRGLVDAGNGSVLTVRLGSGAGDIFQIAAGEFATQSANTVTFYSDATLTTQTAQVNIQYV